MSTWEPVIARIARLAAKPKPFSPAHMPDELWQAVREARERAVPYADIHVAIGTEFYATANQFAGAYRNWCKRRGLDSKR